MQCPECQFENPADSLFCGECGSSLEVTCPNCGAKPPANFKFCNKCGQRLREIPKLEKAVPQPRGEGKTEPFQVYRVLPSNEKPITRGHLSSVRADLVNRRAEMAELESAVDLLQKGRTTIFSICGDAGTGKSRLIEEFKAKLNLDVFQWLEGHAYQQFHNIPYFPIIDFLNSVFRIEEGNSSKIVRQKVESGIESLVGQQENVIHYIGSLYSLHYPEIEGVSPEFWKTQLLNAIVSIFSSLANKKPTVFLLEDLHWADPSFLELLPNILFEVREAAIVLCVYRPSITLFTNDQLRLLSQIYHEIRLQDLSHSDAQDMLESLLKSKSIPAELKQFVKEKAEGNPFYLEEFVNSIIESGTLIRDNGSWKLTEPILKSNISPTIHGVISDRLDRLDQEMKRVIQEASVIGRAFFYQILKKVTELKDDCEKCLSGQERLDLIRTRSFEPDLEYLFKHALTQEVVYSSLLKNERKRLHEKIGLEIELFFHDRLSEFYETLAFHFKNGESLLKAVDYLIKSGEKSVKRYAIEESHQFYKEAFDLLSNKPDKNKEEVELLIELLIKWAYVFYYRGDFRGQIEFFNSHLDLSESVDDKSKRGMFNAWLGLAHDMSGNGDIAQLYLKNALELGEDVGDQALIGYACTWLAWSCIGLGMMEDAITYGERAHEISKQIESDHYLHFKSLGAFNLAYRFLGDVKKASEIGNQLVEYGQKYSNIRSMTLGHTGIGLSHLTAGDFSSASESLKRAIGIAIDPVYSLYAKTFLINVQLLQAEYDEAEKTINEVLSFWQKYGYGICGLYAYGAMGMLSVATGQTDRGLQILQEAINDASRQGHKNFNIAFEQMLGNAYRQISQDESLESQKAEEHLNKAIELALETGAKGLLGPVYLDLGLLHQAEKRTEKAREWFSKAVHVFRDCGAISWLEKYEKELSLLS